MKILRILKKIIHYAERCCTTIAVLCLSGIIVVITIGVFFRYFLNNPLTWVEELSILLLVYMAFFSIASATIKKKHVRADFLLQKFGPRFGVFMGFVNSVLAILFVGVMVYSSYKLLPSLNMISSVLKLIRKVYYYPLLIASPFMILHYVIEIIENAVNLKQHGLSDEEIKREGYT